MRSFTCSALSRTLAGMTVAALLAIPAMAQQPPARMPMQGMSTAAPAAGASPEAQGLKAADDRMMADMNVPMTGNADRDFVAMMIPHHQGAVDMAKVELKYGKDPALRRLARNIVRSQEKQIAQMKAWQAHHHTGQ